MYSLVRHIARGMTFGKYRSVPIVMLSAYFDTSGNRRCTVMTMAGFVSRVEKWDLFQREWPKFLKAHGVTTLHMTDFASGAKSFKGWKGPEHSARRRKFVERAVTHIKRSISQGFAASLVLSDYESVNEEYRLAEFAGSPFVVCGMMCLNQVVTWARNKHVDPKQILYFIEDGDEDKTDLIKRGKIDGFKIIAVPKKDVRAFEACDMAAWKVRTALRNAEARRGEFADIVRSLDPISSIIDKNSATSREKLLLLCRNFGIRRRRGGPTRS